MLDRPVFARLVSVIVRFVSVIPRLVSVIPVLDTGISSSRVGSFTVKALSGELCQIASTQFEIAVYGLYQFA